MMKNFRCEVKNLQGECICVSNSLSAKKFEKAA